MNWTNKPIIKYYYVGIDLAKGNDLSIVHPNKNFELEINKYINDTDILILIYELSRQTFTDYLIYEYNPWDYGSELKLNFKHQGFTK